MHDQSKFIWKLTDGGRLKKMSTVYSERKKRVLQEDKDQRRKNCYLFIQYHCLKQTKYLLSFRSTAQTLIPTCLKLFRSPTVPPCLPTPHAIYTNGQLKVIAYTEACLIDIHVYIYINTYIYLYIYIFQKLCSTPEKVLV